MAVHQAIDEQEALRFRAEFPIFEQTVYLNSCSLGPLSNRARTALQQYAADWSEFGAPAWWQAWIPKLDAAKERFARLIGAQPHEVTISHSISSALSSVASTIDYADRPVVVAADIDFPTIPYQWLSKAPRGVDVRYAQSDGPQVPVSSYESVIRPDVALVATSHVFYATGAIQPVREIAELAHASGARIVVDGYHAVGAIPVDVKALDVDFYVGGVLKWLMGGPGLTFIYVREELIEQVRPTISGWFASAEQFAFNPLDLSFPPTADRLQLGTPAVGAAYSGVAGMDMVLEAEPERIWSRLQELTGLVLERAHASGYRVNSPLDPKQRGGVVMLAVREPEKTVLALAERGFTVDHRPGYVRVSPHFFNTRDDVERFMDALDDIQGN